MSDSITLQEEEPNHVNLQPQSSNLQELQQESKVLNTWAKSSKDLIDKYKNKFDAFKAMADQAGYIDQTKFSIGGEQKSEIFKKIDTDGDGKITSDEWNMGWNNLESQYQETQHKVQIAQQKMEILEALDSKVELRQEVSNSYNNLLGQFKSANSLDDLTDLFNKKSPFKGERIEQPHYIEEPLQNIMNVQKRQSVRPMEALLQQYQTPNKCEFEYQDQGSGKNTYLNNPVIPQINIKLSGSKTQNARLGFIQASPSTSFIPNSGQKVKKENAILHSKVMQSMNFTVDVKESCKPVKRKEELNNFMGKLGLGKYEAPKVTINLDQPNPFERLRHYVNNIGSTSAKRTPSSGLEELVNDKSFNTSTFKQQMKAYKKENNRGDSQNKSILAPTIENPLLQDQSLKSLHLKLIHHQRNASQTGRLPRS